MRHTACGLLFVVALLSLPGCGKTSPGSKNVAVKPPPPGEELLKPALDLMRQATQAGHYRDALQMMNTHLSKENVKQPTPFSPEQKDALQNLCRLDNEEIVELDSLLFRPLDAYHLQQAFLFRDAGRLLEVAKLPPLDQARLCFEWVVRRIQLHEQVDDWLPSDFVLRRGFGGGRDRALAFLALLRQFQIEGCVLAPPGQPAAATAPILAGVLLPRDQKPALYLFDPRLGEPLPGPQGKGIATFADLEAHPDLLKPAAIAADVAAKLEVYQVSPLEALSPRMRLLQELLAFQDKVFLFQDALALSRNLSTVAGRPAVVWNAPGPLKGPPPPSPTRALRLFLPVSEGGVDTANRHKQFLEQQVPWHGIRERYSRMRLLSTEQVPEQALAVLFHKTRELFDTFYLQPEDLFLRGQFDAMLQRVRRIRTVLETEEAAKPLEADEFQKRLAEWRERVKEAYIAFLLRGKEAGGHAKVDAIWSDDQYLLNLLQVESDVPLHRYEKKMLSLILFEACREPLGQQVSYLVASCLHEKAAQLQATQDVLAAGGKDGAVTRENTRYAWANTRGAWKKFLDRYKVNPLDKFSPHDLPLRLVEIEQRFGRGDVGAALGLWEQLHLDMHASFEGRLRLAEVEQQLQTVPADGGALKELLADLDAFQKSDLPKVLGRHLDKARSVPPLARRLELLLGDWAPQGHLYWLQQTAQRRLDSSKAGRTGDGKKQ